MPLHGKPYVSESIATYGCSAQVPFDRTIDPPPVKRQALIEELLLCFQLLNDILGYHLAVSKLSDNAALGYDDLRGALVRIQDQEFRRLEAQHMEAPIYVRAEAVKNLQTRLRELARGGFYRRGKLLRRKI